MEKKAFKKLEGVIPPMVTPFDKRGEIDEPALREVVNYLAARVNGLFICGSYGCGPIMRMDQRKRCAEVTIEAAAGRVPVIVQVGCTDTESTLELAKHAERAGADRVAAYAPYYFHHSDKAILEHFKALAAAVKIPVYLYVNPAFAYYNPSPEALSKLAGVGVAGLKDSTFSVGDHWTYISSVGPAFDVVLGTEALFLPASAFGTRAFVPGLGNSHPDLMVKLWQVCTSGDRAEALAVHKQVTALRDTMKKFGPTTVVVQEMMKLRGINAGYPRAPFIPLDDETRTALAAAMRPFDRL